MTIRIKLRGEFVIRETCATTGKVCHVSRDDCMLQVKFLSEGNTRRRFGQGKTRRHAEAYRCDHCKAWHVGTRGGRR